MPFYALYYFQRATSLRPYDSRMWRALGQCYETLSLNPARATFAGDGLPEVAVTGGSEKDHVMEAIRCYKRALIGEEDVARTLFKLAKLYLRKGNRDSAAWFYELSLVPDLNDPDNLDSNMVEESCRFLENHYNSTRDFVKAEKYAAFARELRQLQGTPESMQSAQ
jgi:anaphase-promoting complex subunit 8